MGEWVEITKGMQEAINSIPNRALLRVDEVSEILQIKQRTVYSWYEADKLKGTNLNGTIRIYRYSVVEIIINGNGKKTNEETIEEVKTKIAKVFQPARKTKGWVRNY